MFEIYIGDELVITTIYPSYCYYDDVVSEWRSCDEGEAEAILIQKFNNSELISYFADIDSKSYRHTAFPIATIHQINR